MTDSCGINSHNVTRWTTVRTSLGRATAGECQRLAVATGQTLRRTLRVRSSKGLNDICEYVVTAEPQGEPAIMAEATERLSLVAAPPDIAHHLDIPLATPVLRVDRIVRNAEGRAVTWHTLYCRQRPPQSRRTNSASPSQGVLSPV